VIATCRHPEDAAELQALAAAKKTIVVEKLDLTDDAGVRSLATKYHGKPIDVLITTQGSWATVTVKIVQALSLDQASIAVPILEHSRY